MRFILYIKTNIFNLKKDLNSREKKLYFALFKKGITSKERK